ncbi:conserved hypothetical protein, partial [Trichinella spiralis]|uniref:hypothetical protein n=1 Tax=Trichinella spiralis TaxID=6334 RepID=UPI0001EFE9F7
TYQFRHRQSRTCLTPLNNMIVMAECYKENLLQQWILEGYNEKEKYFLMNDKLLEIIAR